ncbi:LIM-type zinc finger-containing protein [Cavenderia fasciculata]|uniref:LIM-type zinc finger-containing protein n=1 Tax=Cavenderia fasciculata TaxID=261658 RepID=F4PIH8_CACFS|nr:LIM-type zinc finger-containing protein [Cavenderia fasciculata]EGG25407.1 LIM-type zinc finger-containing protein [Cavenderia fasciculata]|eukprot:XP_004363258.1 LIM-type zinc finger-containing protein [Cavenderia fasciculata]
MSEVETAPPPPPPPPAAPAPPPPPPVSAAPADPGRSALLGSIQNFSSAKLKKVNTNDRKPTDAGPSRAPSSSGGSGGGGSRPVPGGGPSGFGDIFAGGMPKLRSTKGGVDTKDSHTPAPSSSAPAPTPVGSNPTPKPTFVSASKPGAPVLKPSTGVLRQAPVLAKPFAKPSPSVSPAAPSPKPAASPVVRPTQPVKPEPAKPTPTPTPVAAAPAPAPVETFKPAPLPAPVPAPVAAAPAPAPVHVEKKQEESHLATSFNKNVVVNESNITPSGGAPKPAPTVTHTSKPAPVGKTPANWVSPAAGPVNPIGRVVQTASVHVAQPKTNVTSSASIAPKAPIVLPKQPSQTSLKTAPSVSAPIAKPAPVAAPVPIAKPIAPISKPISKPIAKPAPAPTPVAAAIPTPAPTPVVAAPPPPIVVKEEEELIQESKPFVPPVTTTTTTQHNHHHHKEIETKPTVVPTSHQHESHHSNSHVTSTRSFPPAAATNTSSSNLSDNTSPRKKDDGELSCHRCNQFIEGSHYKAMDRAWHIDHFTCKSCNKGIQSFVVHDDQPYCETCYDKLFVEHKTCHICSEPIFGTVVSAMNNHFHQECFKCNSCGSNFPDSEFYQLEGKPWCYSCVQKATAPKFEQCDACQQPINSKTEGLIKVLGNKYHNNERCFSCHGCRKPFPNLNFYEVTNQPYCHDCALRLHQQS